MAESLKQSKNFSSSAGHPELKFLKGRVFEIPATGAFLLTEELDDYFELDRFGTKEEMLEKVNYYLSNEKKREENYTFERYLGEILFYKIEYITTLIIKYFSVQKILYGKNWLQVKIGKSLEIGDNVYIGHNNYIFGKVSIGNDFMSGPNVSWI
ncbi:MAG: glycosyltransferase [Arcobacteraceae bacterium]|nr:glycosyltransferase [Arcobacteraceae bacterium]